MCGLLLLAGFLAPPLVDSHGDALPLGAAARLGTVRFRHPGSIESIAYFAGGKKLVSGGRDNSVRVWDANTGKELCLLKGHTADVNSVTVSRDGRLIASASADGTIRLWEAA